MRSSGASAAISAVTAILLSGCAAMPPEGMENPKRPSIARVAADLEARGQTGMAVALYRRAVEVSGKSAESYAGLGDVYFRSGNLTAAEKAYRSGLERDPRHAKSLLGLGTVLLMRKKYDEAVVHLEVAAPVLRTASAWNRLGIAQMMGGRFDAARKSVSRALYHAPGDIDIRTNVALTAALAGQHAAAISTMRQVVGFSKAELRHHKNLILVLALDERIDEAKKAMPQNLGSGDYRALLAKARRIRKLTDPREKAKVLGTI